MEYYLAKIIYDIGASNNVSEIGKWVEIYRLVKAHSPENAKYKIDVKIKKRDFIVYYSRYEIEILETIE
jgi:hypothetical protein